MDEILTRIQADSSVEVNPALHVGGCDMMDRISKTEVSPPYLDFSSENDGLYGPYIEMYSSTCKKTVSRDF